MHMDTSAAGSMHGLRDPQYHGLPRLLVVAHNHPDLPVANFGT